MGYLADSEIATYCTTVPGVGPLEVQIASDLIDGYKGKTFVAQSFTEQVPLNKKLRGKLRHLPVVSIDNVVGITSGLFQNGAGLYAMDANRSVLAPTDLSFGLVTTQLDPTDILMDLDIYGYFYYVGYGGLNSLVYGRKPQALQITYTAGFTTYPENLKMACAMLAQNVKQRSSFSGELSINSLDYRVQMTSDSFFTSDIKLLLEALL